MRRAPWLWLQLFFVIALAGCASRGPERSIDDPTNSLVFGYVDMEDAPTSIQRATLMQLAPPTEYPYWHMTVRDGLFFNEYIAPGSWQLTSFAGSGFFRGKHEYQFPRQNNQTALRIDKPGIYFLGSFKYKEEKSGFFENGKFSMQKVTRPTEAELLKRILEEDGEIKGSVWEAKIRQRLARLK